MIRIIACGKVREKWMKDGIAEYARRLSAYDRIEFAEAEDEKAPEKNSDAENDIVLEKEGSRILKLIRDDDYVILLDLAGKEMDSPGLADFMERLAVSGHSRIDFVIGGSLGVSKALCERADFRWKLSPNTFPHQLCRLIVLEQIYRAFRIRRNEPYHK